jgi:hypothetical protein
MTNPVAQLHCTGRAEWRLQTGKPAKPLSPNYRLDCDFGTAIIILWKEGGSEPIYVCDSHAKQLGRSRDHFPEAYIIAAPLEPSDNPTKQEDRAQSEKGEAIKSEGSASLTAGRSLADKTAALEPSDNPTKQEDRAQSEKGEAIKSEGFASLIVERSLADKDKKVERETIKRPSGRDLTYGSTAKAMVDEAIWNMATGDHQVYRTALQQGKSPSEAAEAAGGQFAVIHRKISDYSLRLEAIFSKSQTTINVEEFIDKPLEQAVLDVINDRAMSDSEKDAVIQQLGALQEWVKHGLHGEITPLEANRITLAIGERLDWGGNSDVSEGVKPAYRALYGKLKTAICKTDPEAQILYDRLTNLYAAKSEMKGR